MAGPYLSAAELQAYDPRARPWSPGSRARFCCPLPGACEGKRVDAAHRSLLVYPEGGWTCGRCGAKGKLTDAWTDRPALERLPRDRRPAAFVRRVPSVRSIDAPAEERSYDLAPEIRAVTKIRGTLAAAYLQSRGIPEDTAHARGVRFSPAFGSSIAYDRPNGTKETAKGTPAVVFQLRDADGAVSGAQGRRAGDGGFWKGGPSKLTFKAEGVDEMGVFVTPGAFEFPAVVIVEAPIDALTLHLCGVPTAATVGTSCPSWLVERLKLRRVVLAHDADDAGDKAARTVADELAKYGASCERVRPTGAKDWNDALRRHGVSSLSTALAAALRPPTPFLDPFAGDDAPAPKPTSREDALEMASGPLEQQKPKRG